ncbi:capsular polysaccharide biosynthesis protein [Pontibaca methylaminivorans]|uniref:Capsular polysaccharide export protein n=1 Tax=Pontibaca methylaminivorans TaxID=515897 RepID=A0A1R3WIF8_9RHOB|nr:capsular polysaccharide biosynthesis protein [Pontibaca methylaminivorans]SIT77034.1 capsular polysaccharide export protein [Pontibaca methylaminivorans]
MSGRSRETAAAGGENPRLFAFNGGFRAPRLRRILDLSGYRPCLGWPDPRRGDMVAVWGDSPTAWRGRRIARRLGLPLLRVEDAFLRSLRPGRDGEPPMGLLLDRQGVHFDASTASDLERLLAAHPLDAPGLLARAADAITRIREGHLSKYNAFDPETPVPSAGYVLVIDQTRGDASVRASGGDRARFLAMLARAQADHPGSPVIIKTHPETVAGHRAGHFTGADRGPGITLFDRPASPFALLAGARAVYTLSSQMGFEAILAGHRPHVFGTPFYAGWGLSHDEESLPRRQRRLTPAQLFAAAMILYPRWYDPFRDMLCELETVLDNLEAQSRAWRQDRPGWSAGHMRLWKRGHLQAMFGRETPVVFRDRPGDTGRRHMVWAGHANPDDGRIWRLEDGFLRSAGLGAALVPPLSLVLDDLGIYYDPARESRLERLISARETLTQRQMQRAEALIARLVRAGLSKYNLAGAAPALPAGRRILVPGQVADDASVRLGAGDIAGNEALLRAARAANPGAVIIYKPHPDVEAGLREGAIRAGDLADVVATDADPMALLAQVDEVWTMTSLMGFEALVRGVPVTTFGAPFYAGWGLTTDLGPVPGRRRARPGLAGLVHAALIDYPRYRDPVTGAICPVEVVAERLASGALPRPGAGNRLLSKLQGLFASRAALWR